jgi:adenylosuccinate synthase
VTDTRLQVVVGGQYGSEAKGHVAGILAAPEIAPLCIRVAGPNAGHTVVNPATGNRHALRQIPAGAVTNPNATPCIAAGSEIDLTVLSHEVQALEADGIKIRERLRVDPQATIIETRHLTAEDDADLHHLIGSTGKGIGAARADRIMRNARIAADYPDMLGQFGRLEQVAPLARMSVYSAVQIEGTQGYGLGLHAGHYPRCTSSDCTAIDMLAMAQVNPWGYPQKAFEIWVVLRPYPIRVAGTSGPMRDETTWEALGLEPEYTTVTHKMRRVGHWDAQLAQAAVAANGGYDRGGVSPVSVALTMVDQLDPALAAVTDPEIIWFSPAYQRFAAQMLSDIGRRPALVTTSDRTWADMTGWERLS